MRKRENFDEVLLNTLPRLFAQLPNWNGRVGLGGEGTRFDFVPLLGGYVCRGASRSVLRFLADGFRWTDVRHRAPVQWALGTALASPLSIPFRHRGFCVTGLAHPQDLMVMPGNQRLRLFDFAAGRCMVVQKAGFALDSLRREVDLRSGREAPWVPLLSHDVENGVFIEPILEALPLPRLPPWRRKCGGTERVLAVLNDATRNTERPISREEFRQNIDAQLGPALETPLLTPLAREVRRWLDGAFAAVPDSVPVRLCHGDFQPGNVLVGPGDELWLIDWEHGHEGFAAYDELVWRLSSRRGTGLADRLLAFRAGEGRTLGSEAKLTREAALACSVVEDLRFFVMESVSGPYCAIPDGLNLFASELRRLGSRLERLLA